jgi:NADH-quinone oxidoreductase subunit A
MPAEYIPLLVFLALATALPLATLVLSSLLRPSAPSKAKLEAYECGIPAESNARGRFAVHYYVVAILFVIFDVETVFLFPWAVRYRALGWFGVAEAGVFLAILLVGYLWALQKGVFDSL